MASIKKRKVKGKTKFDVLYDDPNAKYMNGAETGQQTKKQKQLSKIFDTEVEAKNF